MRQKKPTIASVIFMVTWETVVLKQTAFCDFPMGILRTEMSDGAFESYWWVHSKSDSKKKFFCMWITRKSEGEWRHRAMWEVRIYTTKGCFGILRVLLLVQRRAMVRWKAGDEYIPNLTSKKIFSIWITRKSGGKWRHRRCGKSIYTRRARIVILSILLLVQRRAMVRWKCLRKAGMSRTQIWSQKIFAIQMWRKLGESDVTTKCKPYHDALCRCFVKLCRTAFNTETNNGALETGNE